MSIEARYVGWTVVHNGSLETSFNAIRDGKDFNINNIILLLLVLLTSSARQISTRSDLVKSTKCHFSNSCEQKGVSFFLFFLLSHGEIVCNQLLS